jgi:2-methylcitrate dehydratase
MRCVEDKNFTRDYHDPAKRSIANALSVRLRDGTELPEITVEYPIGHTRRRAEGMPLLEAKFRTNLARRFSPERAEAILAASRDAAALARMPVHDYVDLYVL